MAKRQHSEEVSEMSSGCVLGTAGDKIIKLKGRVDSSDLKMPEG